MHIYKPYISSLQTCAAPSNCAIQYDSISNSLIATWTGGAAPYSVIFRVDNTVYAPQVVNTTTATLSLAGSSSGSHTGLAEVYYSCGGQYPYCLSSTLTFNISTTTPSAGYNCTNGSCVPPPAGTTGTYPDLTTCQAACPPGGGVGYNCASPGNCQPAAPGTIGTYTTMTTCQTACPASSGGGSTCDPVTCPSATNYCVAGTCIPKSYAVFAAIGFGAVLLLSVLK